MMVMDGGGGRAFPIASRTSYKERGIHHLLVQDWAILPFLNAGYEIVATKEDAQVIEAMDERVIGQKENSPNL